MIDGDSVMVKFGRICPADSQLCVTYGINLAVCDVFYKNGIKKKLEE